MMVTVMMIWIKAEIRMVGMVSLGNVRRSRTSPQLPPCACVKAVSCEMAANGAGSGRQRSEGTRGLGEVVAVISGQYHRLFPWAWPHFGAVLTDHHDQWHGTCWKNRSSSLSRSQQITARSDLEHSRSTEWRNWRRPNWRSMPSFCN